MRTNMTVQKVEVVENTNAVLVTCSHSTMRNSGHCRSVQYITLPSEAPRVGSKVWATVEINKQ